MAQLSGTDLNVKISTKSDTKGISDTERELGRLEKMTASATGASQKFAKGLLLAGTAAGVAAAGGVAASSKAAWDQVYAVEQATVALSAYEKDGKKVDKVLNDLVSYARSDMGVLFQRQDLFAAAQGLRVMGAETGNLTNYVEIMSRSVGLGLSTFDELGRVIGRVGSTGRMTGDDFDMLTKSGFQLDESLRNTDTTFEQLFAHLEKGIPADAMAGQADTIRGKSIRLQSAFRNLGLEILGVDKDTSKFIEGGLGDRMVKGMDGLIQLLKDAAPTIAVFAAGITAAIGGAVDFFSTHGDTIRGVLTFLADNLPVVAGAILGGLIPAFVAWATTMWTVTLPALAALMIPLAKFLLIGAAVGLLAKVVMDNWEPISGFFANLWGAITNTLSGVIDWIGEKIEWFKDNWALAIGMVVGFFATLPITLPLLVGMAIFKIIQYLRGVNWTEVFSAIGRAFGAVWDGIKNAAINAFNYLKSIKWGDILTGIGKGIGNAVISLIEGAIKGATAGIPMLGDALKNFHIPRFETGTTFAPGGLALVGERGPELVNLPRGSQVTTASQTREVLSNRAGVVIENFNMTVQDTVDWTLGLAKLDQTIAARLG